MIPRATAYFRALPLCLGVSMVLTDLQAASGARVRALVAPFVIQCGVPSLILAWYSTLLAATWALVMRLRGGEGLEACPPSV